MAMDRLSQSQDWKPALVIPFPTIRRTGKIRRTAEILTRRHGRAAESYWRQVISGMAGQMEAAGLHEVVIGAEIESFRHAVQAELRRSHPGHQDGGDAA